ncbi:MAG: FUSC family protein [Jiangellales bacterium]
MAGVRTLWLSPSKRLRAAALTILQASLAAMIAWSFSRYVLDRPDPFFAPLAAMSAIGVSMERRLRRSTEMVLGVAVGILVGDLFIAWAGRGVWQIGLVVALAMGAAVLLRGGPIVVLQASSTAVVIATILPPVSETGYALGRFTDALIGGAVGLAMTLLLPAHPMRQVTRVASPLLDGMHQSLVRLARALRERDESLAATALAEAHGLQVSVEQLATVVGASHEIVVLAPGRWSSRETLAHIEVALPYVDAAVRDIRVLARQTQSALQRGDAIPPGLDVAVDECAVAIQALQRSIDSDGDLGAARAASIRAAQAATDAVQHTSGMLAQTVAGQVRSVAADLLYATGLTADDVSHLLPDLPEPVSRRSARHQVALPLDTSDDVVRREP